MASAVLKAGDESKEAPEGPNRLTNIKTKEISLVDVAANQTTFLVVKRADGTESVEKAQTKTEDGVSFPASAYAYVPDPKQPSTWKLRLYDKPEDEKPSAKLTAAAAAALGPKGWRGNKVQIPAADLPGVKAKVRAAWAKAHEGASEDKPEMPASIKKNAVRRANAIVDAIREIRYAVEVAPVSETDTAIPRDLALTLRSMQIELRRFSEEKLESNCYPGVSGFYFGAPFQPLSAQCKKDILAALEAVEAQLESLSESREGESLLSPDEAKAVVASADKIGAAIATHYIDVTKASSAKYGEVQLRDHQGKWTEAAGGSPDGSQIGPHVGHVQVQLSSLAKARESAPVGSKKRWLLGKQMAALEQLVSTKAPVSSAIDSVRKAIERSTSDLLELTAILDHKLDAESIKKVVSSVADVGAELDACTEVVGDLLKADGGTAPRTETNMSANTPAAQTPAVAAPVKKSHLAQLVDLTKQFKGAVGELKSGQVAVDKFDGIASGLETIRGECEVTKYLEQSKLRKRASTESTPAPAISQPQVATPPSGEVVETMKRYEAKLSEFDERNKKLDAELQKRDQTVASLKDEIVELKKFREAPSHISEAEVELLKRDGDSEAEGEVTWGFDLSAEMAEERAAQAD